MPDADLLKTFDAPEIAVLADGAKIEGGDAQRLGAHLAVPAIEAVEVQIRIGIWQTPRLDRMGIINEQKENVAVAAVELWSCLW